MKSIRIMATVCVIFTSTHVTHAAIGYACKVAHNIGKTVQKIITRSKAARYGGAVFAAIAYNYYKNDHYYKNRKYLYVSGTDENQASSIDDITTTMQGMNIHSDHSPTRRYVNALYATTHPEAFEQQESVLDIDPEMVYRCRVQSIVKSMYRDGLLELNQQHQKALVNAIVVFTKNEENFAETHHAFYHGTQDFYNMIKRTAEFQKNSGKDISHYFFFREPGHNNALNEIDDPRQHAHDSTWKEFQDNYCKMVKYSQHMISQPFGGGPSSADSRSIQPSFNHENSKFLCANRTATSFSTDVQGGRNSLRFITPIIISDGVDKVVGNIFFPAWTKGIGTSGLNMAAHFIDSFYRKYYELPEPETIQTPESLDALVQILIPKEKCKRIFNAKGNNVPTKDYTDQTLADEHWHDFRFTKEQDKRMHAVIPLDPEIFENPSSGIIMNAVVFAETQKFQEMIQEIKGKQSL